MPDERAPYTLGDVELLDRIARHDGPYHAKGYEVVRAKRLREAGLVRGGRLGERYLQLTQGGRAFLQRANRHREGTP